MAEETAAETRTARAIEETILISDFIVFKGRGIAVIWKDGAPVDAVSINVWN